MKVGAKLAILRVAHFVLTNILAGVTTKFHFRYYTIIRNALIILSKIIVRCNKYSLFSFTGVLKLSILQTVGNLSFLWILYDCISF